MTDEPTNAGKTSNTGEVLVRADRARVHPNSGDFEVQSTGRGDFEVNTKHPHEDAVPKGVLTLHGQASAAEDILANVQDITASLNAHLHRLLGPEPLPTSTQAGEDSMPAGALHRLDHAIRLLGAELRHLETRVAQLEIL